jgi:hypothetical protein
VANPHAQKAHQKEKKIAERERREDGNRKKNKN